MADEEITNPIAKARQAAAREALKGQTAKGEVQSLVEQERQRQENQVSSQHRDLLGGQKVADPLEDYSIQYRDLLREHREAEKAAKLREIQALTGPGEVEAEEDAQVNIEPVPEPVPGE